MWLHGVYRRVRAPQASAVMPAPEPAADALCNFWAYNCLFCAVCTFVRQLLHPACTWHPNLLSANMARSPAAVVVLAALLASLNLAQAAALYTGELAPAVFMQVDSQNSQCCSAVFEGGELEPLAGTEPARQLLGSMHLLGPFRSPSHAPVLPCEPAGDASSFINSFKNTPAISLPGAELRLVTGNDEAGAGLGLGLANMAALQVRASQRGWHCRLPQVQELHRVGKRVGRRAVEGGGAECMWARMWQYGAPSCIHSAASPGTVLQHGSGAAAPETPC